MLPFDALARDQTFHLYNAPRNTAQEEVPKRHPICLACHASGIARYRASRSHRRDPPLTSGLRSLHGWGKMFTAYIRSPQPSWLGQDVHRLHQVSAAFMAGAGVLSPAAARDCLKLFIGKLITFLAGQCQHLRGRAALLNPGLLLFCKLIEIHGTSKIGHGSPAQLRHVSSRNPGTAPPRSSGMALPRNICV